MSLLLLVISLILVGAPPTFEFSNPLMRLGFLKKPYPFCPRHDFESQRMSRPNRGMAVDPPAELVSIAQLLSSPSLYHRETVKVRGTVTQPELHIDDTGLFIRFVFVLEDAGNTLVVFGHHDRTQGNIQIETDQRVEVIGIFWKDRVANDHHFRNNLEAMTVTKYPPLHPDAA